MPKRIIDGDSLWVSEKLSTVPERYRVEYTWILPLAQANGCFECSPMLVWRTCYSALRADWTTSDVAAMLDAFEAAKMLFRFQIAGKTYGFFPGVQKAHRLPKPSDRIKYAAPWNKGMVPAKELAKFLGLTARDVSEEYKDVVASKSRVGRKSVESGSPTGNGSGAGVGSGVGDSAGYGVGNGNGDGGGAATRNTASQQVASLSSNTSTHNTQHVSPSRSSSSSNLSGDELGPATNPVTASDFVETFRLSLRSNPDAASFRPEWQSYWVEDFERLLSWVSPVELFDILAISQIEKNQKYYVRPGKLVERFDLLKRMVGESKKGMSAIRAQFRKKLESPVSVEDMIVFIEKGLGETSLEDELD